MDESLYLSADHAECIVISKLINRFKKEVTLYKMKRFRRVEQTKEPR
jgi:hypothetical protein